MQCVPDSLTVSDQNLVSTNFGAVPNSVSMKRNSIESAISQKQGIEPAMQDRKNVVDRKSQGKTSVTKVLKQESIKHYKVEDKVSLESMLKDGLITNEEYERMKK